jgi:hypothetical protein
LYPKDRSRVGYWPVYSVTSHIRMQHISNKCIAKTYCFYRKLNPVGEQRRIGRCYRVMTDLCRLIFWTLVDLMRARATLEAEIWVLRQQINVLRRAAPRRHVVVADQLYPRT